jgi:hypothetical protein
LPEYCSCQCKWDWYSAEEVERRRREERREGKRGKRRLVEDRGV